jgi:hypothetical protein
LKIEGIDGIDGLGSSDTAALKYLMGFLVGEIRELGRAVSPAKVA